MRRKDREMDRAFALEVLDKCGWAVLATVDGEGLPYGIPLSIVRDGDVLFFHCAHLGEKVDNLRREPRVCLTAVGDTCPRTDEFSTEYECAVVRGRAEEVTDEAEKVEALRLLCRRHVPTHMDEFDAEIAASLKRTAVWRVSIDSVTGKRKKYGSDGTELKFGRMEPEHEA